MRDVVFLYNIINKHYNIAIDDKLEFFSHRGIVYNLRSNLSNDLKLNYIELMDLSIVFSIGYK